MKQKRYRILLYVLAFLLCFSAPVASFAASPEEETAASLRHLLTYYQEVPVLLIGQADEEEVVLGKGVDEVRAIASMSKLMTYYVVMQAIDQGKLALNQKVTISDQAASFNYPGSSNYGLKAGEQVTVSQLLTGMMVVSGNDAACALAEATSGREEDFVVLMNDAARRLGYQTMHFVNASGLTTKDRQYNRSSARELYRFILLLMEKYPQIKDLHKITVVREPDRSFDKKSTLLEYLSGIPGLKGLKTGTSIEAGACFAGLFEVQSSKMKMTYDIVTIVMGAPTNDARWRTTKELVDIAAGSFSPRVIVDAAQPVERYEMPDAKSGSVILYPAATFNDFTYVNAKFDVSFEIDRTIKAPTKADQTFGRIRIERDGRLLKEIPIVAHTPTEEAGLFTKLQRGLQNFFSFLTGLVA